MAEVVEGVAGEASAEEAGVALVAEGGAGAGVVVGEGAGGAGAGAEAGGRAAGAHPTGA